MNFLYHYSNDFQLCNSLWHLFDDKCRCYVTYHLQSILLGFKEQLFSTSYIQYVFIIQSRGSTMKLAASIRAAQHNN